MDWRHAVAAAAVAAAAIWLVRPVPERRIRVLPAGVVELHSEMIVEGGTELRGARAGTVLRMAPDFSGRAAIVARGTGIVLRDFTIDGNRDALEVRAGLPPYDVPFERFTRNNGVLAEGVSRLSVEAVRFRNIAGFAILVSRSKEITVDRVEVADSGSRNPSGANNTTGGILFEEGTSGFRVSHSGFRNIRGNGVWTHSLYTSPRNARGSIALNSFDTIGRDAIQAGHATEVRVERNRGVRIGYPDEAVDMQAQAVPVAIDTAGNVDRSAYTANVFEEINGKCVDLDGFHDGEVTGNTCVNRRGPEQYRYGNYGIVMNNSNPDMQSRNIRIEGNRIESPLFGGIFVIGTGHRILRNRLMNLNAAHCNENAARFGCYYAAGEPGMLRSGIYLGKGAHRPAPAQGNVIEENEITGFRMRSRCIELAPGVTASANVIRDNRCRDR